LAAPEVGSPKFQSTELIPCADAKQFEKVEGDKGTKLKVVQLTDWLEKDKGARLF
jgi:hypothetical protein